VISVDLLRGVIMVVMALDHVRDYFSNAPFDPVDLAKTTPAYFFTRFITHFCAPGFTFFAGTAAYLSLGRGKGKGAVARFLVSRGLFLMLLEVVVLRFVWQMNLDKSTGAATLWALGWSMVFLAAVIRLPVGAIGAIGVVVVLAHNALDTLHAANLGALAPLWHVLHEPGPAGTVGGIAVFIGYPLVPWIGVMAAGYAFGAILSKPRPARRRVVAILGAGLVVFFVALRLSNLYGDPKPFTRGKDTLFTVMAFLNCEKYPPSLLYLCMTLGPLFLLLAAFDRDGAPGPLARATSVFGRVPMFFYVLHLLVIHLGIMAVTAVEFRSVTGPEFTWAFSGSPDWMSPPPPGAGFSLVGVYVAWVAVVVLLYPACRWYADLKRRRDDWWLSYV